MIEIIVAAMSAVAAGFAYLARREAAQVNDAVNHRHPQNSTRLYDLALRNDERIEKLSGRVDKIAKAVDKIADKCPLLLND